MIKHLSFFYGLAFSICAPVLLQAQVDEAQAAWSAFDEAAIVLSQQTHVNPRMRFKLLTSVSGERSDLWSSFESELIGFEGEYARLKPMVLNSGIAELQALVASGELSYEGLVKFYIYRIRLFENDQERFLNAVISLNPEVIDEARGIDEGLAGGSGSVSDSPLLGMPILLKDNIGVEGMPTTAGAAVLKDNFTGDAFIVSQLRKSGALIFGKANLSEWAYFFCSGCPLGYSYVGGQTLNPHNRMVIESGGSSSGSAVAVAANYAVAAVGSETSGSILSPASLNSVVGFKPTTGALSRSGVVPIASSLDTAGPIARSVEDAALLFNAMSGFDQDDRSMPLLSDDLRLLTPDSSSVLQGLEGLNLGVVRGLTRHLDYAAVVSSISEFGVQTTEFAMAGLEADGFGELLGGEMKRDLARYLEDNAADGVDVSSVEDIVAVNRDSDINQEHSFAPYGQALFDQIVANDLTGEQLQELGIRLQRSARMQLDELFLQHRLDALLSLNNFHAGMAALANYPAITIPIGLDLAGKPVGLTVITPTFSEQILVNIAAVLEAILGFGVSPPLQYQ